ncbi:MAG: hypothetical protein GC158_11630 [Cyanobacteria bacterium RI_101]|nr:hypothetical protein [Cyanobacteria bacterium RI_101]
MKLENPAPWYVSKRGNLLAQEFLFELEPKQVVYTGDESESPFDYLTLFAREDGSLVTLAIAIRATESQITDGNFFPSEDLEKLKKANIPVLILVIDVKRNHYFFGWAKEDFASRSFDTPQKQTLRPATPEEIEILKQEIMALS